MLSTCLYYYPYIVEYDNYADFALSVKWMSDGAILLNIVASKRVVETFE